MDADYESTLGTSSPHVLSNACAFCHRILSSDNDTVYLDSINVCGDCKFLLLEDFESTSHDLYPRRLSRRRSHSSESIESMFSQQFSQLINLARQNQSTVSDNDNYQSVDGDLASRLLHQTTSSRTTPNGSRRWRRVSSDTESDGFDSLYGDNESNFSFRRYAYSTNGGDSDDGRSFMDNDNFGELESDTDIDPMNAGYQWNSEDDEDDSDWEEAEDERNTNLGHVRGLSRSNGDLLANFEESEAQNNFGESGDYFGTRGFENLLERLVESESSGRGAPPTSVSFMNHMPRITINEDKSESMACAICKEALSVGTVVNRLPCSHLFHSSCILPWLSTRNTCPLCRHELPTDDMDYEERKRNETIRIRIQEVNHDVTANEEQSEVLANEVPVGNGVERDVSRNKWYFLAAPIVGVVGITLMLCFGNPSRDRTWRSPQRSQRRWWSFL